MDVPDKIRKKRIWAGAGVAPENWCKHYTEGQMAAINVICDQIRQNGRCELSHAQIGERASVGKGTIQKALDIAISLGHLRKVRRVEDGLSNVLQAGN